MQTYTITPAETQPKDPAFQTHRGALLVLWSRNLKLYFESRFNWLYKSGKENNTAVTWLVVQNEGKDVVGCGSILKRNFIYQGKTIKAGIAIDLAVNEAHRVFGPALPLIRAVAEGGKTQNIDFVFAFPNKKGELLFKRVGYSDIGSSHLWVHLLRSEGKLKKFIKNKFLCFVASKIANCCIYILDSLFVAFYKDGSVCREQKHADGPFDVLWNAEKNRSVIMLEKNAESLNWRYVENTSKDYLFFCRYNKSGDTLLGFIVFDIENGVCVIYDFLSKTGGGEYYKLFAAFIRHIHKTGAESIILSYFGEPSFEGILRRSFFLKGSGKRACLIRIYKTPSCLEGVVLSKRETWHLFDGDLDL